MSASSAQLDTSIKELNQLLEARLGLDVLALAGAKDADPTRDRARIRDALKRHLMERFRDDDIDMSTIVREATLDATPNLFVDASKAQQLAEATSENLIEANVTYLSNTMTALVANDGTASKVVTSMTTTFVGAVGVAAANGISNIMKTEALSWSAAALQYLGSAAGLASIVGSILVLAADLTYIIGSTQRSVVGMVVNLTQTAFTVPNWMGGYGGGTGAGLYVQHGEMTSFFSTLEQLDGVDVNLSAPLQGDDGSIAYAVGLFGGTKKFGTYGIMGYFQLFPATGGPGGWMGMFFNPYSKKSCVRSSYQPALWTAGQSNFLSDYLNPGQLTSTSGEHNGITLSGYLDKASGTMAYFNFVLSS